MATIETVPAADLTGLSGSLLSVEDHPVGDGEFAERFATILHAEADPDGSLGGDPGDIVVSVPAGGFAYAPDQPVQVVRLDP